ACLRWHAVADTGPDAHGYPRIPAITPGRRRPGDLGRPLAGRVPGREGARCPRRPHTRRNQFRVDRRHGQPARAALPQGHGRHPRGTGHHPGQGSDHPLPDPPSLRLHLPDRQGAGLPAPESLRRLLGRMGQPSRDPDRGSIVKDRLFILSQYLLPHHLLSRLAGCIAECRIGWIKGPFIRWFARRFDVDMSQALVEDLDAYEHFNAFFTRALKADARPLDPSPEAVLCPADGAISQLGPIQNGRIFQAKGHSFSLLELLGGDAERAAPFMGGDFATIYLSPRDYHRVHMPLA